MANEDGLQNAAILMMSLGEAEASEVFKHLSPEEVQTPRAKPSPRPRQLTREKVDEVVDKFTGVSGLAEPAGLQLRRLRALGAEAGAGRRQGRFAD